MKDMRVSHGRGLTLFFALTPFEVDIRGLLRDVRV